MDQWPTETGQVRAKFVRRLTWLAIGFFLLGWVLAVNTVRP